MLLRLRDHGIGVLQERDRADAVDQRRVGAGGSGGYPDRSSFRPYVLVDEAPSRRAVTPTQPWMESRPRGPRGLEAGCVGRAVAWPLARERFDVLSFLAPSALTGDVATAGDRRSDALARAHAVQPLGLLSRLRPPALPLSSAGALPLVGELVFTTTATSQAEWAVHGWPTLLALGMGPYGHGHGHGRAGGRRFPRAECAERAGLAGNWVGARDDFSRLWTEATPPTAGAAERSVGLVGIPGALFLAAAAEGDAGAWPRVRLSWRHSRGTVVAAVREALLHRVARLGEMAATKGHDDGIAGSAPYRAAAALHLVAQRSALADVQDRLASVDVSVRHAAVREAAALERALVSHLAEAGLWILPSSALPRPQL